jgi:hypothetical protein
MKSPWSEKIKDDLSAIVACKRQGKCESLKSLNSTSKKPCYVAKIIFNEFKQFGLV